MSERFFPQEEKIRHWRENIESQKGESHILNQRNKKYSSTLLAFELIKNQNM